MFNLFFQNLILHIKIDLINKYNLLCIKIYLLYISTYTINGR